MRPETAQLTERLTASRHSSGQGGVWSVNIGEPANPVHRHEMLSTAVPAASGLLDRPADWIGLPADGPARRPFELQHTIRDKCHIVRIILANLGAVRRCPLVNSIWDACRSVKPHPDCPPPRTRIDRMRFHHSRTNVPRPCATKAASFSKIESLSPRHGLVLGQSPASTDGKSYPLQIGHRQRETR